MVTASNFLFFHTIDELPFLCPEVETKVNQVIFLMVKAI